MRHIVIYTSMHFSFTLNMNCIPQYPSQYLLLSTLLKRPINITRCGGIRMMIEMGLLFFSHFGFRLSNTIRTNFINFLFTKNNNNNLTNENWIFILKIVCIPLPVALEIQNDNKNEFRFLLICPKSNTYDRYTVHGTRLVTIIHYKLMCYIKTAHLYVM